VYEKFPVKPSLASHTKNKRKHVFASHQLPEEVGSEPLGEVNNSVAGVLGVENVLEVLLLTSTEIYKKNG